MSKGHKKGDFMVGGQQAARSANLTAIGYLAIKKQEGAEDGKTLVKKWVKKELHSQQEVLIECITGEIYRYLIGKYQPKIRTGGANVILSEFIPYRSARDIFDNPKYKGNAESYQRGFILQLEGFMKVLFSSITLEENDLSDMNYGLATNPPGGVVTSKPTKLNEDGIMVLDEPPPEPEPKSKVKKVEPPVVDPTYYEFIKIDHGQSLNSMRIKESKIKKYAEIKYFSPPSKDDFDKDSAIFVDKRSKKDRCTIYGIWTGTSRKYNIEPFFIDRVLLHFLCKIIDKNYIENLNYQPSILPLFDGRLLSFFKWKDDKWKTQRPYFRENSFLSANTFYGGKYSSMKYSAMWDYFEKSKYFAIAKLVFTNDVLYNNIAKYASDPAHLPDKQTEIRAKIKMNIESLYYAISTDLDFCVFCHKQENKEKIEKDINESFQRICKNHSGENSERYYEHLNGIVPIDNERLRKLTDIGYYFDDAEIIEAAHVFIQDLYKTIQNTDWKVGTFGGKKTAFLTREKRIIYKQLPHRVSEMALSCIMYDFMPKYRLFRTLHDLSYLVNDAIKNPKIARSPSTDAFYKNMLLGLKNLGSNLSEPQQRALRFFSVKHGIPKQERFIDMGSIENELRHYIKTGNLR